MQLLGKRFAALIVDIIVITLITWIISALIYPLIALMGAFEILNYWLILAALIIIGYFTYLEGKYCTTLGKTLIKIRVESDEGKMGYKKAFIRNLSKILWFPLIIDFIVGYASGGSKLRYLDKVTGTGVFYLLSEDKKPLKTQESQTQFN